MSSFGDFVPLSLDQLLIMADETCYPDAVVSMARELLEARRNVHCIHNVPVCDYCAECMLRGTA